MRIPSRICVYCGIPQSQTIKTGPQDRCSYCRAALSEVPSSDNPPTIAPIHFLSFLALAVAVAALLCIVLTDDPTKQLGGSPMAVGPMILILFWAAVTMVTIMLGASAALIAYFRLNKCDAEYFPKWRNAGLTAVVTLSAVILLDVAGILKVCTMIQR